MKLETANQSDMNSTNCSSSLFESEAEMIGSRDVPAFQETKRKRS